MDEDLGVYDEFCGGGGFTAGAARVPDVWSKVAVNHWQPAVDSHAANFPDADHRRADVCGLDMATMPRAGIFLASPACPPWTDARGRRRDFDKQTTHQGVLFGQQGAGDETVKKARLLMEEVVTYLRAMTRRGRPVLVGAVENVVQCRLWADWDRWVREIELEGYKTRLIAFNSMHAAPPRSRRAPQSRDRLYLAYWHRSLGRDPDWDRWLRPDAYCPTCDETISAVQVFKKRGVDMGRYGPQYIYLCPRRSCRNRPVTPAVLPALAAIDPTIPGVAINARPANNPLAESTINRIKAGIRRYWLPLLVPVGGTWRGNGAAGARPLEQAMPTRTARETDGVAIPPLPFLTPLRGGGDKDRARPVTQPLSTVCASGNHHGLALPPLVMRNTTPRGGESRCTPVDEPLRTVTASGKQSLLTWDQQLLVPYYGSSATALPASSPVGTLTARDRYGVARPDSGDVDAHTVDDLIGNVRFRMLETHEIAAAMAFEPDYKMVATSKRDKVRLYGNAVTPPVAELIVSALVECITGQPVT